MGRQSKRKDILDRKLKNFITRLENMRREHMETIKEEERGAEAEDRKDGRRAKGKTATEDYQRTLETE